MSNARERGAGGDGVIHSGTQRKASVEGVAEGEHVCVCACACVCVCVRVSVMTRVMGKLFKLNFKKLR